MMIQRYNNVDSTLLQNSIICLISNIESTSLQNLFFAAISNQRYNNVDSTLLQNLTIITFFDLIQCTIHIKCKIKTYESPNDYYTTF